MIAELDANSENLAEQYDTLINKAHANKDEEAFYVAQAEELAEGAIDRHTSFTPDDVVMVFSDGSMYGTLDAATFATQSRPAAHHMSRRILDETATDLTARG